MDLDRVSLDSMENRGRHAGTCVNEGKARPSKNLLYLFK